MLVVSPEIGTATRLRKFGPEFSTQAGGGGWFTTTRIPALMLNLRGILMGRGGKNGLSGLKTLTLDIEESLMGQF